VISSAGEGARKPPAILALAAHPLRWRQLSELALSDRRVRELTARLDERQSLVSYHLGRLRARRLVAMRRSSADGRAAYDRVELVTCAALLSVAGEMLHPVLLRSRTIKLRTGVPRVGSVRIARWGCPRDPQP
jgi:DNA-binding transcriptional ArsR family regulator